MVSLKTQPVACVIRTVPATLADQIGKGIQEVAAYLCESGVEAAGPPFGRSLWEPGSELRIGIPISASIAGNGAVLPDELPGGRAARAMHVGPHDRIGATLAELRRWCAEQGLTEAGMPWETYLTNPREVADPRQWRNELFLPVQERR